LFSFYVSIYTHSIHEQKRGIEVDVFHRTLEKRLEELKAKQQKIKEQHETELGEIQQ
jgi:hypothetical protein